MKTCRNFPTVAARRMQAVELLAQGFAQKEVCQRLGITPRTLRNYLADAEVQAALREIQGERLDALLRKALAGAQKMLAKLEAVAESAGKDSDRISAAGKFLDIVLRLCAPAGLDVNLHHAVNAEDTALRAEMNRRLGADPKLAEATALIAEEQCRAMDALRKAVAI